MTTPLFQLSIDGENIGKPLPYEEGCKWQDIIAKTFPDKVVWLKRVEAQYGRYTLENYLDDMLDYPEEWIDIGEQPCMLVLGREGFC